MNKIQICWLMVCLIYILNLVLYIIKQSFIGGIMGWACCLVLGIEMIFLNKR